MLIILYFIVINIQYILFSDEGTCSAEFTGISPVINLNTLRGNIQFHLECLKGKSKWFPRLSGETLVYPE